MLDIFYVASAQVTAIVQPIEMLKDNTFKPIEMLKDNTFKPIEMLKDNIFKPIGICMSLKFLYSDGRQKKNRFQ